MATDTNRPKSDANAGDKQEDAATTAREAAREVAGEAKTTVQELGKEVADQARSTAGFVRDQTRSSLEEGKAQIAQQVSGVVRAFQKGSEELRNDNLGRLAEQGEWVAGRVEELQNYLRNTDIDDLMDDLRNTARRHPAMFIGGLFAAGLLVARLLASSEEHASMRARRRERNERGATGGA